MKKLAAFPTAARRPVVKPHHPCCFQPSDGPHQADCLFAPRPVLAEPPSGAGQPQEPAPLPPRPPISPPAVTPPARSPDPVLESLGASVLIPTSLRPTATSTLAGKLAGAGAKVRREKLTDEQLAILATAPEADVLVIEAGAGTGKTFTLAKLARSLLGRGQYTAFNTKLVADSKKKLPCSCPANTIHSLAFGQVGKLYSGRIGGRMMRNTEVAAILGIESIIVTGPDGKDKVLQAGWLASQVMKAVRRFCQSADREVEVHHFSRMEGLDLPGSRVNEESVREQLVGKAREAWADLSVPNGRLPFTHDCYVKVWQLGTPEISADYILLDEAQDTSPVMLDVLAKQAARGIKIILVGDSQQQIYEWRGAVNALAAFPGAPRRFLSQSFRFGEAIALVANAVLSHLSERSALVLRGLLSIPSQVKRVAEPDCILCRTNACAVGHFLRAIAAGRKPYLVGGTKEIMLFVRAAIDLKARRGTEHPELACFTSWPEVQAYARSDEGEDLKLMVKLIDEFGAEEILAGLEQMPEQKDADLVICTAHKSKGLEWKRVKLAADFPTLSKSGDSDLRLLYVACTRAQEVLDVSECPPFCGGAKRANDGFNGEGGEERVIDIDDARNWVNEVTEQVSEAVADSAADGAPVIRVAPVSTTSSPPAPASFQAVPTDNTFAKGKDGGWLIRGPRGQSGRVEVRLKSGKRTWKEIGKVVWENESVALYSVK